MLGWPTTRNLRPRRTDRGPRTAGPDWKSPVVFQAALLPPTVAEDGPIGSPQICPVALLTTAPSKIVKDPLYTPMPSISVHVVLSPINNAELAGPSYPMTPRSLVLFA